MRGRLAYAPGFTYLGTVENNGLRYYPVTSGVAISIGDFIIITSGYAALGTTLQGVIGVGIAQSGNTAAEASTDGAVSVAVLPLDQSHQFMVPCEDDAVIVRTDVGTIRDLQSEDGIDNGDTVTLGLGFYIDDFDVSAEAIDAFTYGFAVGHFEYVAAS